MSKITLLNEGKEGSFVPTKTTIEVKKIYA